MNSALVEELLNQDENSLLDFKRDQYPFDGANEIQKSELLKDILAFSNVIKDTSAFILIGVEEVKGSRSKVIGVKNHLDDARIQQFVNSKTRRPVIFSYEAFVFEGKQLGIIEILPQTRLPVFLTNDYGKLRKNIVYIRHGSSTSEVAPDEVVEMILPTLKQSFEAPKLELQFADISKHTELGCSLNLDSYIVEYDEHTINSMQDSKAPNSIFTHAFLVNDEREEYKIELADYIVLRSLLNPIGFCVRNVSSVSANNVRVRIEIQSHEHFVIYDMDKMPKKPSRTLMDDISKNSLRQTIKAIQYDIKIKHRGDRWILEANLGIIQPKATIWSESVFFVGATKSCELNFDAFIYADNLPEPIAVPLCINLRSELRDFDYTKLK